MKKICSKCKIPKLRKEFGKNKSNKDGLQSYCKRCKHVVDAEYRRKFRTKIIDKKRRKRWSDENKDKISKYNRIYYRKNREIILCRRKTECLMIFDKKPKKPKNIPKYNYDIKINPKEVKNG